MAVAWSGAFAWSVKVRPPAWLPVLILLAVWAVYVSDRLLDARTALCTDKHSRLRERHRFHWRHRRALVPLAAVAATAALWIVVLCMPAVARERNSVLAAASLAYFARVHAGRGRFPVFSKEFLVGFLFTAGCVLPAWTLARSAWPLAAPAAFFALLAWLNCAAINRWETGRTDRSIARAGGLLAAAGGLAAALLLFFEPRTAALLAAGACAALLLALLDCVRGRLAPVTLRAAADFVLLTPAILLAGLVR